MKTRNPKRKTKSDNGGSLHPLVSRRRTCKCQWCVKWSPIIHRVDSKLTGKLKKDFDNLITHFMCEGEDGDVAQAKLDGSWPGWEWMPEAIRAHQDKPANIRS
jgi:hypothetical protein